MKASDWINVALASASFILAAISLWSVRATIRQNKQMLEQNKQMLEQNGQILENSTRPYIVAMYEAIDISRDDTTRYVVLKNCGQAAGTLQEIDISGDTTPELLEQTSLLKGSTIAPGQKFFYYFGESTPESPEFIDVTLTYTNSMDKTYTETTRLQMFRGSTIVRTSSLKSIPLFLQQILDRLL